MNNTFRQQSRRKKINNPSHSDPFLSLSHSSEKKGELSLNQYKERAFCDPFNYFFLCLTSLSSFLLALQTVMISFTITELQQQLHFLKICFQCYTYVQVSPTGFT